MDRITQKDLDRMVDRINKVTSSPPTPYTQTKKHVLAGENQKYQRAIYKANIGNYHLDYAYGGVKLVRMVNDGGGITVISSGGYGTKRALYHWMGAFLAGHYQAKS